MPAVAVAVTSINFTFKPNGQLLVPYNATTSVTIQERYAYDKDVVAAWWSNDNSAHNNKNKKDVPDDGTTPV